ncbi:MFS-type transporter SLC18B1-like protein [Leptotrombidium deliense]|uniref:MFS-type transporter SLC18B1-like protein n=1 Tax=Leptotrombidium deliense TaxID=299467 RepID=A0A443SK53_9ACAR|nr:MFS-type transporter SLC18B1-like protein [Leptotrombidium deliense]
MTLSGGLFALFVLPQESVVYAIAGQLWGFVADKINNCHVACCIGCMLSAAAFIFCGPIYPLPLEPNIWLVIIAQALYGLGTGGQLVGSFTEGLKETVKSGFPENISTYAMVSALFSSGFSMGLKMLTKIDLCSGSIGPIAGGLLVEHFGYGKACYGILFLQLFLTAMIIVYNLSKKTSQHGNLKINPHSLSNKSIDRESGVWNDWKNKASITGLRFVRRNMM